MKKIAYVGVDYHLNTVTIAVMVEGKREFHETIRMKNEDKAIRRYLKKLSKDFEIRTCYEASSCGYVFQRKMKTWGYPCDVIAPSLIPSKRGERRKNDFRDARNLARLYAKGLLSVVHPPSEEEESVRALIRCRTAFKESEKRAKHQINALLLAHDYRWPKTKWTDEHRRWLLALHLPHEHLQQVLEEHLGHLEYLRSRLQCLNERIKQIAQSDIYAPSVNKLRVLKGIETLSAMVLITEITDFRRFPNPGAMMSFLGLIPSEHSSGDKQRGGGITKAGNPRCRTILVESVQHYTRRPYVSKQMRDALSQVDAHSAQVALKCMKRLHKRFWILTMKGKIRPVAITAVAREFVGFIWAMMQPVPVGACSVKQPQ